LGAAANDPCGVVKKVHVNVGTIGHIDHGKTTLTAASLAVQARKGLAKLKSYQAIAKGGTVRDENKTVTIVTAHVEYETAKRHYPPRRPSLAQASRRARETRHGRGSTQHHIDAVLSGSAMPRQGRAA
jgi:hypothetical protein